MSRRLITDQTTPDLIGMCSFCRWLGYCERRVNPAGREVLICSECLAAERGEEHPILPLKPLPRPKPPARETQRPAKPAARRASA